MPSETTGTNSRRVKLRYENGQPKWLYIYDRLEQEEKYISFEMFSVEDSQILPIFKSLYPEWVTVAKTREVWHQEDWIIHLDDVERVGHIFEMESTQAPELEIERLMSLIKPFLLKRLIGSNEDYIGL